MRGASGLLNVASARFELDSAEETSSQIREPQRSLRILPCGEDGQTAGLTLRHAAELMGGPFRPLRSEVTVRRRIRSCQPKNLPLGRDFLRGVGRAPLRQRLSVPHEVALMSFRPVTGAAVRR